MTIVLLGYMGSGKTSIGKRLSSKLNYNFIDFDHFIEEKEQCSVAEIFKRKGEIYFRKLESKYLNEVLEVENAVVSLGGGTPCYSNNMVRISSSENVASIYLKTSIKTLTDRLLKQMNSRPLIKHLGNYAELSEFIGKHLFERNNFYLQSDISITTDDKSVEAISVEITERLF